MDTRIKLNKWRSPKAQKHNSEWMLTCSVAIIFFNMLATTRQACATVSSLWSFGPKWPQMVISLKVRHQQVFRYWCQSSGVISTLVLKLVSSHRLSHLVSCVCRFMAARGSWGCTKGPTSKGRWWSALMTVPQSTTPTSCVRPTPAWWPTVPGFSTTSPTTGATSTSWSAASTGSTATGGRPRLALAPSAGSQSFNSTSALALIRKCLSRYLHWHNTINKWQANSDPSCGFSLYVSQAKPLVRRYGSYMEDYSSCGW